MSINLKGKNLLPSPKIFHIRPKQLKNQVFVPLGQAMDILLTNDDGIQAKGLWALYDRFEPSHRVTVVAPDRERSAIGHAITLHAPIRADVVSMNGAQR